MLSWTIEQLASNVAQALSAEHSGSAKSRLRPVPDVRTIRYYTTLAILDRPVESNGQPAHYNRRHLLQLMATMRLQAQGFTLGQVKERILGLSGEPLEDLARLPPSLKALGCDQVGGNGTAGSLTDERRDIASSRNPEEQQVKPIGAPSTVPANSAERMPLTALTGVHLNEHVMLLVSGSRAFSETDLLAMRTAAAPLLDYLRGHRQTGERT